MSNSLVENAEESQKKSLRERKTAATKVVRLFDEELHIDAGVYDTSVDTELMIESVSIDATETFCEIGCGSGAISLFLAKKSFDGIAGDINPAAIENAKRNAATMQIANVDFRLSNGFENIPEQFDVLICNPPYNNHTASDLADRMYWDPNDELKRSFFQNASAHLNVNGRIYFGWANFNELDPQLPFRLATENGFEIMQQFHRPSRNQKFIFTVIEFKRVK